MVYNASGDVDINGRIASNVKVLRAGSKLSLADLSARCGVSRSMLSLVERGEISPTAVVLERIAFGLGVVLAKLFNDPEATVDPVARKADHVPWQDPESGYVRRNISPPNYPSPLQIVDVMLPAGARVAYESGAREVEINQQVWVREGQIVVSVGHTAHTLLEDDCLAMQLDRPVSFHNRSRKIARYNVIIFTLDGRGGVR